MEGENMEIVELSNEQRKRIIDWVRPDLKDHLSYQNLNLFNAVYNPEKNIYLTFTYMLSEGIRRTGNPSTDYEYIILLEDIQFRVGCSEFFGGSYKPQLCYYSETINDEDILELISFYNEHSTEMLSLCIKFMKKNNIKANSFTEWYLKNRS